MVRLRCIVCLLFTFLPLQLDAQSSSQSSPQSPSQSSSQPGYVAPLNSCGKEPSVANRYVVKLRRGYSLDEHLSHLRLSRDHPHLMDVHDHVEFIQAYSGTLTPEALRKVRSDPGVLEVAQDHYMRRPQAPDMIPNTADSASAEAMTAIHQPSKLTKRIFGKHKWKWKGKGKEQESGPEKIRVRAQKHVHWNLHWMSNRGFWKRAVYGPSTAPRYDYQYVENAGQGVDIYIVGDGVSLTSKEFIGDLHPRIARVGSFMGNQPRAGTLVAAVAAGNLSGVAKYATIVDAPLRAGTEWVDGRLGPTMTAVIQALQRITTRHLAKMRGVPDGKASVVHISASTACLNKQLWDAFNKATTAGLAIVAAYDVSLRIEGRQFPCDFMNVICTAPMGTDFQNIRNPEFDQWGGFTAPGVTDERIEKNIPGSKPSKSDLAAAHVAGAAAIFIGWESLKEIPVLLYRLRINSNREVRRDGARQFPVHTGVDWDKQRIQPYDMGILNLTLLDEAIGTPQMPITIVTDAPRYSRSRSPSIDGEPPATVEDDPTVGTSCAADAIGGSRTDSLYLISNARNQTDFVWCFDADPTLFSIPQQIGPCVGGLCPYVKVVESQEQPPSFSMSTVTFLPDYEDIDDTPRVNTYNENRCQYAKAMYQLFGSIHLQCSQGASGIAGGWAKHPHPQRGYWVELGLCNPADVDAGRC